MAARPSRARGFTLVEVSVTVVIIAVLAAVGLVSYRRRISAMRMAEATHLSGNIRQAQEAYKAETGAYANVSSSLAAYYPAANPGTFRTAWGGPCTNCTDPNAWNLLPVKPDAPVMYGYSTVAGVGGTLPTPISPGGFTSDGIGRNANTTTAPLGPSDPFYVVEAYGDTDGNGVPCTIVGYSNSTDLVVTNEGE